MRNGAGFSCTCHVSVASPYLLHTLASPGTARVWQGAYQYTDDLLHLEAVAQKSEFHASSSVLVSDFLPAGKWAPFLTSHLDQRYVAFLTWGMHCGFRVGFNPASPLQSVTSNLLSALRQVDIGQTITAEVAVRRLAITPSLVETHTNPIGLIPKLHQPNKFRLIVDLSAPSDFSVNDGIDPTLCSLQYAMVDEAARLTRQVGPGALLSKLDLSSIYRRV